MPWQILIRSLQKSTGGRSDRGKEEFRLWFFQGACASLSENSRSKLCIAEYLARIFYRNAINIGLRSLNSSAGRRIEAGDEVEVDFDSGNDLRPYQEPKYQGQARFLNLCRS